MQHLKYVPATSPFTIVSKAAVEAAGDMYGTVDGGAVGTGPYKLEGWISGSEIALTKNEYWWGDHEKQLFDRVVYSIIGDNTAAALAAQSGQLDYVHAITSDTFPIYQSIANANFLTVTGTTSRYLAFNTAKAPMDDVHLRRAISYAIDKSAITHAIGGEYANVSGRVPMPDSMFYLDPEAWLKADNETMESYAYNPQSPLRKSRM